MSNTFQMSVNSIELALVVFTYFEFGFNFPVQEKLLQKELVPIFLSTFLNYIVPCLRNEGEFLCSVNLWVPLTVLDVTHGPPNILLNCAPESYHQTKPNPEHFAINELQEHNALFLGLFF